MHKFKFIGSEHEVTITVTKKNAAAKKATPGSSHTFYAISKGAILGQDGKPDQAIIEITDQPPTGYNVRL